MNLYLASEAGLPRRMGLSREESANPAMFWFIYHTILVGYKRGVFESFVPCGFAGISLAGFFRLFVKQKMLIASEIHIKILMVL